MKESELDENTEHTRTETGRATHVLVQKNKYIGEGKDEVFPTRSLAQPPTLEKTRTRTY